MNKTCQERGCGQENISCFLPKQESCDSHLPFIEMLLDEASGESQRIGMVVLHPLDRHSSEKQEGTPVIYVLRGAPGTPLQLAPTPKPSIPPPVNCLPWGGHYHLIILLSLRACLAWAGVEPALLFRVTDAQPRRLVPPRCLAHSERSAKRGCPCPSSAWSRSVPRAQLPA